MRKTGGLADTVVGYTPSALRELRATGFYIYGYQPASLLTAVLLALSVYRKKTDWQRLIKAGMEQDLSWTRWRRPIFNCLRSWSPEKASGRRKDVENEDGLTERCLQGECEVRDRSFLRVGVVRVVRSSMVLQHIAKLIHCHIRFASGHCQISCMQAA